MKIVIITSKHYLTFLILDEYQVIGLRKKEIQLKYFINQNQQKKQFQDEFSNLFSSTFYLKLSKLEKLEDITTLENLNEFIQEYEKYNDKLEEIRNVRKNIIFILLFLEFGKEF